MKCKLSDHMLPAPVGGGFAMEDYWVWCGSVIKGEDGRYHMFASRWPKKFPMHPGWLVSSEIVRASCDTPDGTYQFEEVVLPERGPQYWDGRMTHNPHIKKIGNKYVLYYLGTTHPFNDPEIHLSLQDPRVLVARSNKRIGIAVADSVFGPWKRFDKPLVEPRPDKFDNFMVTNPAPCLGPDDRMLLIYKTLHYETRPYTKLSVHVPVQELGAAIADRFDGDYTAVRTDTPLLAEYDLEDPFIWYDEDGYNMMVKDMDGRLCGEELGGVLGHSKDGLHWEFEKDYLFYSRSILWDDGVVRKMGNLDRPFLLFENGKPTHAFFATSDISIDEGEITATKTWNMVIPLKF